MSYDFIDMWSAMITRTAAIELYFVNIARRGDADESYIIENTMIDIVFLTPDNIEKMPELYGDHAVLLNPNMTLDGMGQGGYTAEYLTEEEYNEFLTQSEHFMS